MGTLPYDNFGMAQEVSIETNPTTAETSGGGIKINMIPRDGGNTFSGDLHFSGMVEAWQSDNITQELRDIGATTPTATERMYDINPSFGGPIIRDKLWFFVSGRLNRGNLAPAGASFFVEDPVTGRLGPGPERGVNKTATDNISFRITWQATPKNKITTYRDQFWRYQSHFLGNATTDWATSPQEYQRGTQYVWPTKWTSTVSNRLLIEAGFQYWGYDNTLFVPQDGVLQDRPALGLPPALQTTPWHAGVLLGQLLPPVCPAIPRLRRVSRAGGGMSRSVGLKTTRRCRSGTRVEVRFASSSPRTRRSSTKRSTATSASTSRTSGRSTV